MTDLDGAGEGCGCQHAPYPDRNEIELALAAGVSDIGNRRRHNEDAIGLCQVTDVRGVPVMLAVVCDGVSTTESSRDAAEAAVDAAIAMLAKNVADGADHPTATREAAEAAAAAAAGLGTPQNAGRAPSCTYVSAVVAPGEVTVGWVGDSRAYWLAPDGSGVRLTEDDSWAAHMVAKGLLPAAEAYSDPRAHAILGWLGADARNVTAHVTTYEPTGPGVVVVCTDGLWNYLPEPEQLAPVALAQENGSALGAARALVQRALAAGGHDNITVAVVPCLPPGTAE